ncbi:hypothetical protein A5736_11665 [Mycobacterium sp. SP-6446]|nr:hypothetical protein A5736_11665 [Mycobacterium sp. SP-6446]
MRCIVVAINVAAADFSEVPGNLLFVHDALAHDAGQAAAFPLQMHIAVLLPPRPRRPSIHECFGESLYEPYGIGVPVLRYVSDLGLEFVSGLVEAVPQQISYGCAVKPRNQAFGARFLNQHQPSVVGIVVGRGLVDPAQNSCEDVRTDSVSQYFVEVDPAVLKCVLDFQYPFQVGRFQRVSGTRKFDFQSYKERRDAPAIYGSALLPQVHLACIEGNGVFGRSASRAGPRYRLQISTQAQGGR